MSDYKDDLNRLEVKVDKLDDRMNEQNTILAVNTEQLKIHIEGVKQTRELINLKEKEIALKLEPIEKHVSLINAVFKICTIAAGIAGFVLIVLQIMGKR